MKMKTLIKIGLTILLLFASGIEIFPEKKIIEEVLVEEWIVPVYAVDSGGKSVTDLKKSDMELFVDGKKVKDFNFLKKAFFFDGTEKKPPKKLFRQEEKIIVLVFDVALSESVSIMKSKAIAEKLVKNAGLNTRFLVFIIESFKGLTYLGGPTKDKNRVFDIVKRKVPSRENQRSVSAMLEEDSGKRAKFDEHDLAFFMEQARQSLSHKSAYFASSFESLYYAISNIIGTKFIYLFTEGISGEAWMRGDSHGSKMASYLLRSGAVLFFINPTGGRGSDSESGEEFLKILSTLSGGKYLYGDTQKINREIDNVHRAYYEITFESPTDQSGGFLRIEVRSKKKGVKIHTIRTLEKSKGYLALNEFEKKLLILNIISKNPLFKVPVTSQDVQITAETEGDNEIKYQVFIPEHFRNRNLDLFKVYLSTVRSEPVIERTSLHFSNEKISITMKNKKKYNNHFVLLNHELGLALVKGFSIRKIKITNVSFRNRILAFNLSGFKKKIYKNKHIGLFRVSVKILNKNGEEINSKEKEVTSLKDNSSFKIPIKKNLPEGSNILIIARDLISGEEVNVTHSVL